jgi:hypothetical protein
MTTTGIDPTETVLAGRWVMQDGCMVGDAIEQRIGALVAGYLFELRRAADGWEVLYRDPATAAFWELTYPSGEMHGGGPRLLRRIDATEALSKYGVGS